VVEVVESPADVRRAVAAARDRGQSIGLVPTMGALHNGHEQLIAQCDRETDLAVVSIFVNPTQFGPAEDFNRYPRSIADDVRRCGAAGAGLVFTPSVATIYPNGTGSTYVEVPGLSEALEGACRPGHFRGVATVVLKLFEIVQPDLAIFGQKDYQQQLLIRRMVSDLHVPVVIRIAPTIREPDGLVYSSRNRYLNAQERQAALVLYRALEAARQSVAAGQRQADPIRQLLRNTLESQPGVQLEYAEVADAETLEPLRDLGKGRGAVALLAVRIGSTRLIDNALLAD
jgi:pantoate--beta-alanine ligase